MNFGIPTGKFLKLGVSHTKATQRVMPSVMCKNLYAKAKINRGVYHFKRLVNVI